MSDPFRQQAERVLELAAELSEDLENEPEPEQVDRRTEELVSRCRTLAEDASGLELGETGVELLQSVKRAVDEVLELARLRKKRLGTQLKHLGNSGRTLRSYRGGGDEQRQTRLDRKG